MVDAPERGNACDTAAAARLGHGHEIKHFLDAGMEQCHGTHHTGFVCDEEGQSRQEVLCAVFGRLCLLASGGRRRSLLGAIDCDLADNVECGVPERMVSRRARVVRQERSREPFVVCIGHGDVCDDGELGDRGGMGKVSASVTD